MVEKRVITPEARLSFPALFRPAKPMKEGDTPKYQCELIFPAGTDIQQLKAAANQAAHDKWGNSPPKGCRSPFREVGGRESDLPELEGCTFISPRSTDKPGVVVGSAREPCLDESEVFGGCYAKASVTAFAYDKGVNKGVAFALNNVWVTRKGEPFGNRVDAESEFADCEPDAEAQGAVSSLL